MPSLFISHASADKAEAIALAEWLRSQGWADYFLDISIDGGHGLLPGQRWQHRLATEAQRCEAILALISPAWLGSAWCVGELAMAARGGKRLFGIVIKSVALDSIPSTIRAEWQLCDLTVAGQRPTFSVEQETRVAPTQVSFSGAGLAALRAGLEDARLDAGTFAWPPTDEPERSPYRGFKPLQSKDAAVYFGREAEITHAMERLRAMRQPGSPSMLVILGPSGSGKSSFLRAGLWPHIDREERRFLALPTLRPARSILDGEEGLATSLYEALRPVRPLNRMEARRACRNPADLTALLSVLHAHRRARIQSDADIPWLVFAIDQAEELYRADSAADSAGFITSLVEQLDNARSNLPSIALLTIRTDLYGLIQGDSRFSTIERETLDLRTLDRTRYQRIIEGPAQRARKAGRSLVLEDELTAALLDEQNSLGADPLPLLAFTLERLHEDYGAAGSLKLDHYRDLGGIEGAIDSALRIALENPDHAPRIAADATTQQAALKEALIPFLAEVDDVDSTPRRRPCAREEIPSQAYPLIERLVNARLLTQSGDAKTGVIVEIAHDALLHQWKTLREGLAAEAKDLRELLSVERSTHDWLANDRQEAWLEHTGTRFENAHALLSTRFAARLGPNGAAYLEACRASDESDRQRARREIEQARILQATQAEAQRRTNVLQRRIGVGLLLTFLILAAASALVWYLAVVSSTQASQLMAHTANEALQDSRNERALRLALLATQSSWLKKPHEDAWAQLARAAYSILPLQSFDAVIGVSPETSTFLTRDGPTLITCRSVESGQAVGELRSDAPYVFAAIIPGGERTLTIDAAHTARIWRLNAFLEIAGTRSMENQAVSLQTSSAVEQVILSDDGKSVAILLEDNSARVIDLESGLYWPNLLLSTDIQGIRFPGSGRFAVVERSDGPSELYQRETGHLAAGMDLSDVRTGMRTDRAVFKVHVADPDAPDDVVLWDTANDHRLATLRSSPNADCRATELTEDGERLLLTCDQPPHLTLRRTADASVIAEIKLTDLEDDPVFTDDGRYLVLRTKPDSFEVFDGMTGQPRGGRHVPFEVRSWFLEPRSAQLFASSASGTAQRFNLESIYGRSLIRASSQVPPTQHRDISEVAVTAGIRRINNIVKQTTWFDEWEVQPERRSTRASQSEAGGDSLVSDKFFLVDGGGLGTITADGATYIWPADSEYAAPPLFHNLSVESVFRATNGHVLTIDAGRRMRDWGRLGYEYDAQFAMVDASERHIGAVSYSTDLRYATERFGGKVRLWDLQSGLLSEEDRIASHAQFLGDGSRILLVGLSELSIRQVPGMKQLLGPLSCGGATIDSTLVDATNSYLAVHAADGNVCAWHQDGGGLVFQGKFTASATISFDLGVLNLLVHEGTVLKEVDLATGTVRTIPNPTVDSEMEILPWHNPRQPRGELTSSRYGTARLWRRGSTLMLEQLGRRPVIMVLRDGMDASFFHAIFNPSGSQAATFSSDGGPVTLWRTAEQADPLALSCGDGVRIRNVEFAGDRKLLGLSIDGLLCVWDVETGRLTQSSVARSDATTLIGSPDGRYFLTRTDSQENRLELWSASDLRTYPFRFVFPVKVYGVDFTPDSRRVRFAGDHGYSYRYIDVDWLEDPAKLRDAVCQHVPVSFSKLTLSDPHHSDGLPNQSDLDRCRPRESHPKP